MALLLIAIAYGIADCRIALYGKLNSMRADPDRTISLRAPYHASASLICTYPKDRVIKLYATELRRNAHLENGSRHYIERKQRVARIEVHNRFLRPPKPYFPMIL